MNPSGATPTTVYGSLLRVIVRPIRAGSLAKRRRQSAERGRGARRAVLRGRLGSDGLRDGDKATCAGLVFLNGDDGCAVSLAGVDEYGPGDHGDAGMKPKGRGGLKGSFDGGQLAVTWIAGAVVEHGAAAEPAAVAALDGLQLLLGQVARAGLIFLALDANPGAAQWRQIALLEILVAEAGGWGAFRRRLLRRGN